MDGNQIKDHIVINEILGVPQSLDSRFLLLSGGTMTGNIVMTTDTYIGPTSTTGIYFKTGFVGIGTTGPTEALTILSSANDALSISSTGLSSKFIFSTGWSAGTSDYLGIRRSAVSSPQILLTAVGNVGIGTTGPGAKLDVMSAYTQSVADTSQLRLTDTSASYFGSIGFDDALGTAMIFDLNYSSPQAYYQFRNANSPLVTILGSGNVGIGTTVPNGKLIVTGTSLAASSSGYLAPFRITTGTGLYNDESLSFGVHDGDYSFIQAVHAGDAYRNLLLNSEGGNVGIGITTPTEKLTVNGALRSYSGLSGVVASSLFADFTAGIGRLLASGPDNTTGGTLQFITASANAGVYNTALTINNLGNVGIGTTGPDYKLDVSGQTNTSSLSIAAGTAYSSISSNPGAAAAILASAPTTGLLTLAEVTVTNAPTFSDMTLGSVLFAGTAGILAQDNANLFWDNTNKRLGVGTAAPQTLLEINGTTRITRAGVDTQYIQFEASAAGCFIRSTGGIGKTLMFMINSPSQGPVFMCGAEGAEGAALAFNAFGLGGVAVGNAYEATDPGEGYLVVSRAVGIGIEAPSALLHLAAGSATASTAPIKFTSGTLLTTPELGAMEYTDDGTTGHLYFTLNVASTVTRVQII